MIKKDCETADIALQKAYVKGKFIYCGNEKFFIKGVTYGTFAPDENGAQFPEQHVIETDFRMMSQSGINCVRTYTPPPLFLLDCARKYSLKVMVGLPWEQHIAFLEESKRQNEILSRVCEYVDSVSHHPAVLCYTIGNEIPAPVVRWYGKKKIERFLLRMYNAVKEKDPQTLVTYVNYPTTEYLDLSFLDFYSFNVYLESEEKLHAYIRRLHNLCQNLPLVLAEIGLDSMRNGEQKQADTLMWQIKTIFSGGCAGMFVFAWTDEWWRGGFEITDWDFGLVNRKREPKPALEVVEKYLSTSPFGYVRQKFISVVVCSYNGSATIADTLDGLFRMQYQHFEVIVVNDGSTDHLPEIVSQYPVKLISTPNRGLSSARNTGMYHAEGEIVAYIDDDAYPDRDWLNYINIAFQTTTHQAIGGPNLVPDEDGNLAKCVAASPGGPIHVLLTDEIAEHIPGCNMAFRKSALQSTGGFDHRYRSAGDDVDLCWRLQENNHTIGFHPAAIVWHHRRSSVKAYWKQQKGYGKAEALLEDKWPHRYNALGHYAWAGSVYGGGNTWPLKTTKEKIFYGEWGSALFQSVYQPSGNYLLHLPLMPEWYLLCAIAAAAGFGGFFWAPLFFGWYFAAAGIFIVTLQAFISAKKNLRSFVDLKGAKPVLITTLLHIMQPLARLVGRLENGLTPWRRRGEMVRLKNFFEKRNLILNYWSEHWLATDEWLSRIVRHLQTMRATVKKGGNFDRWDLHSRIDLFSTVRAYLLVEDHGGGKQYLRLRYKLQLSKLALIPLIILLSVSASAFAMGNTITGGIVAAITILLAFRIFAGMVRSVRTLTAAFSNIGEVQMQLSSGFEFPDNPKIVVTRQPAENQIEEAAIS